MHASMHMISTMIASIFIIQQEKVVANPRYFGCFLLHFVLVSFKASSDAIFLFSRSLLNN